MFRDRIVRFLVLLGVAVLVITELLGYFSLLGRRPLIFAWLISGFLLAMWASRYGFLFSKPSARPPLWLCGTVVAIGGIAAIIALTALISPPNSADAMAYHMPRVVYWKQARSVAWRRSLREPGPVLRISGERGWRVAARERTGLGPARPGCHGPGLCNPAEWNPPGFGCEERLRARAVAGLCGVFRTAARSF
jgi:hypothetical protein